MKSLVWLNVETGQFSNSWIESDYPKHETNDLIKAAKEKGNHWKLIEFHCLNDDNFKFSNSMKIK